MQPAKGCPDKEAGSPMTDDLTALLAILTGRRNVAVTRFVTTTGKGAH